MTTHPPTEDLLARYGATFEHHPALPLADIDLVASVTNQSRFEPIDPATVDRYVAALEDGAAFPPIIVRRVPAQSAKTRPQLVIVGGNHRARAHLDAGRKRIGAYLIDCDDLTALELAYADNATHGLPPTDTERLAHALLLVDRGRTAADAARTVGINAQRITRHLAQVGVDRRAAKTGVAGDYARFPESARHRLASIADDRVFTKVIRTVAANNIGTVAITKLVGDINAQPDVRSAMDLIQAHVRQHRTTTATARGVGRPTHNAYLTLRTALGTIKGLDPVDIVERCATATDRRDLHDALIAAGRQLMAIDKRLQDDRHLEAVQ